MSSEYCLVHFLALICAAQLHKTRGLDDSVLVSALMIMPQTLLLEFKYSHLCSTS